MADPHHEALRRAFQSQRSDPGPGCPPEATLIDLVLGELPPEERLPLGDHVVACRGCAEDWRTLRALHQSLGGIEGSEGEEDQALIPGPVKRVKGRTWLPIVTGAAALIAALALFWTPLSHKAERQPPLTRGELSQEGGGALSPASGVRLTHAPPSLKWTALAGPQEVSIYNEAGGLVYRAVGVEGGTLSLDSDTQDHLTQGPYQWEVRAGSEGVTLGPFWFELEAP